MTLPFEPKVLDFVDRVRESFQKQGAMHTLGAVLTRVEPGAVDISFEAAPGLTQQHGFVHAGMLSAAMDSACGYAAFTLMPANAGVLTIEFKVNLMAPAKGQRFRTEGRVLKSGRTVAFAEATAYAINGDKETRIATMSCTLMCVQGRENITN